MIKIPPYLKKGDTIGITCPAGYMAAEKVQTCIEVLQQWGYKVKKGNTVGGSSSTYFSGTDDERLAELQQMLDDKNITAILCGRGGYGTGRIVEQIDFKKFRKYPKWIIGFSDITVLHSHINRQFGIATIHSKMCNSFPKDWLLATDIQKASIESIRQCLAGESMNYTTAYNNKNKTGSPGKPPSRSNSPFINGSLV